MYVYTYNINRALVYYMQVFKKFTRCIFKFAISQHYSLLSLLLC